MKFVHPKLTLIAVLVNRIIKNHTLSRYKTLSAVSIILAENNSQQMVLFLIQLEIVFLGGLVTAVVPSRINIPMQIANNWFIMIHHSVVGLWDTLADSVPCKAPRGCNHLWGPYKLRCQTGHNGW